MTHRMLTLAVDQAMGHHHHSTECNSPVRRIEIYEGSHFGTTLGQIGHKLGVRGSPIKSLRYECRSEGMVFVNRYQRISSIIYDPRYIIVSSAILQLFVAVYRPDFTEI
jgi:hypothetical protein